MLEKNNSSEQTIITSEFRRQTKELLKTKTWDTRESLLGVGRVEFQQVEPDLLEPAAAKEIRLTTWQEKLEQTKQVLLKANPNRKYEIKPENDGELFEKLAEGKEKRIMWSGTTITLAQQPLEWKESGVAIPVYPIKYNEWIACENPDYKKAFENAGLPSPFAGIGVSVLMETKDGLYVLTRRGLETPAYPGRLYSPGGGPKPGETSTGAILQEILEETGLKKGIHFDSSRLQMLALIEDSHYQGGNHARPEIIAYMPLNIEFSEVEKTQYERAKSKGQEADVWAVEAFSSFAPTFGYRLAFHGEEMCPPTEAGLAHAALFKSLQTESPNQALERSKAVINRLNSYRRHKYVPPIEKLAEHE